jgi:hypothetical protein
MVRALHSVSLYHNISFRISLGQRVKTLTNEIQVSSLTLEIQIIYKFESPERE